MKVTTVLLFGCLFFISCRKDKGEIDYNGYPKEIGEIVINRCATSGCHNTESAPACAGINLSSWESMYNGGYSNSVLIPYQPNLSCFFTFSNPYHDLGISQHPTMPLNNKNLSREEVLSIRNWINEGGLNRDGEMKFPDGTSDSRIYVANQGCDLIEVFDAKSKLLIRAFNIGKGVQIESPHDLMMSPDGKVLYVSFYVNSMIEKYSTVDNRKVGEIVLSDFSWHAMAVSGDGKTAIVSNLASNKLVILDLENMAVKNWIHLANAHGCLMNEDGTIAYVTSLYSNFIFKVNLSDINNIIVKEVVLQTGELPLVFGDHKPYSLSYFPDYSKYAVTCQGTKEVRIFNANNDSLLKTIETSGVPQLLSFSKKNPYLFVSCMSDISNNESSSQVNIINYNSLAFISSVFSGYQPRGLCVDDANDCVWIANRNITSSGWQPHHTTECQGKNGYMTLINMNSLKLVDGWKCETSVDPYSVVIKK